MPSQHNIVYGNNQKLHYVADGRIRKKWPIVAPGGPTRRANLRPKGMNNPAVFCYRRAVMQSLIHIPEFYNYLCRKHDCGKAMKDCVFCAFRDLAFKYWSISKSPISKADSNLFDEAIARCPQQSDYQVDPNDTFSPGQKDAHEFVEALCDIFRKIQDVGSPVQSESIHRLFNFKLRERWTCDDCSAKSSQYPTWCGLSAAIHGRGGQPLREQLFRPEPLDDVRCASKECNGAAKRRTRHTVITQAPEILVLQIKIFRWTLFGEPVKILSRCPYEELLDLTEFTRHQVPLRYQLMSVVSHGGASITAGHYVADLRCREPGLFANANDSTTSVRGDSREMLRPTYQPYLLFYQKVGGKMAKEI